MNDEHPARPHDDPPRARRDVRVLFRDGALLRDGTLLRDSTLALCLALLALVPRPGIGVALAVLVVALVVGSGAGGVWRGALTLGAMAVVQVTAVVVAVSGGPDPFPLAELPFALVRAGGPWLVAVAWTQQAQIRRSARLTAVQHEQQRLAAAERRRQAGRMALAEGLHDDLGHALSLVALNLGALEVRRDLDPDVVAQVRTAREQVGTAVERLGASVASLRAGTDHRGPVTGSATVTVDALLEDARRAGMTVALDGSALTEGVGGVFAGRVLQEALTNAAKHAPGQPVRVTGRLEGDDLLLTISTPSAGRDGRPSTPRPGTGLLALAREAVRRGGAVSWDDGADEFVLQARVPRADAAATPVVLPAEDGLTPVFDLASAAHRRGTIVLVSAAAVIVLALAAVELAARGLS